jgi:hypothetical protein
MARHPGVRGFGINHPAIVPRALARFAVPLLLLALTLAGCDLGDEETRPPQPGAPVDDEQVAEQVLPSGATRNTVRVGGSDAATDAAGVADALYPAPGDGDRPTAVALVD